MVLEIVSPEVRALSGLWQGQMGSVMGHSHHRRPPSLSEIVWRNKVEDAPSSPHCLKIVSALDSDLTPNCESFPLPSPHIQIISWATPARHHSIGGLLMTDMMVKVKVMEMVVI